MNTEFNRFCHILHIVANYMDSYVGDLFIDLPTAWEQYEDREKNYPIFCVRKTGADLIERYEGCFRSQYDRTPTFDETIEYAQKSLGVDFTIEITPYKLIITNYKVEKWELKDLEDRLKDYNTEIEIINKKAE